MKPFLLYIYKDNNRWFQNSWYSLPNLLGADHLVQKNYIVVVLSKTLDNLNLGDLVVYTFPPKSHKTSQHWVVAGKSLHYYLPGKRYLSYLPNYKCQYY